MRPEIEDNIVDRIYDLVEYPPSVKFEDALAKLIAMAEPFRRTFDSVKPIELE